MRRQNRRQQRAADLSVGGVGGATDHPGEAMYRAKPRIRQRQTAIKADQPHHVPSRRIIGLDHAAQGCKSGLQPLPTERVCHRVGLAAQIGLDQLCHRVQPRR